MNDSYRKRLAKKLQMKRRECDVFRGFGKPQHIPRNLEGHVHMQGFTLT